MAEDVGRGPYRSILRSTRWSIRRSAILVRGFSPSPTTNPDISKGSSRASNSFAMGIIRALFSLLGVPMWGSFAPPGKVTLRWTWISIALGSMSSHCRPSTSPLRIPVNSNRAM